MPSTSRWFVGSSSSSSSGPPTSARAIGQALLPAARQRLAALAHRRRSRPCRGPRRSGRPSRARRGPRRAAPRAARRRRSCPRRRRGPAGRSRRAAACAPSACPRSAARGPRGSSGASTCRSRSARRGRRGRPRRRPARAPRREARPRTTSRSPGRRRAAQAPADQLFLLAARQLLDPPLLAQRAAPRAHAPGPDEAHGQARARVARRDAALVLAQPGLQVLRGARVEGAVAAAQDVDEGQGLAPGARRGMRAPPHNRTVNRGHEYRERVAGEAAGHDVLDWLVPALRALGSRHLGRAARARRAVARRLAGGRARTCSRAGQSLAWRRPPWRGAGRCRCRSPCCTATRTCSPWPSRAGCPRSRTAASSSTRCCTACGCRFPGAVPLHRLGRGTSGLVLFALTSEARREGAAAWRTGRRREGVPRARRGPAVPRSVHRRRPDRPRAAPAARQPCTRRRPTAGRRVSHVRVVGERDGGTLVASRSRPAARTRSGSTSRPRATRSSAIRCTPRAAASPGPRRCPAKAATGCTPGAWLSTTRRRAGGSSSSARRPRRCAEAAFSS